MQRIAEERVVAMAPVAMAWMLRNPIVDAPTIGATEARHLSDAVAALDISLSDDEVTVIEDHYSPSPRPTSK